ncbi:TonB-dependent receptor [Parapedobacter koreensis]|uniref:Outer membrane cobalamin receptor protein n=1 Tax=Parapedobacter koreensis TaxID=332977 RepID=A0A1H7EXG4_9SPHI|nr:TonB-dependent receptor [Parapedobacter koreensis]SEK18519.1 Outer membrane cobalamin receptor protein [Parapedobacter koreensis]
MIAEKIYINLFLQYAFIATFVLCVTTFAAYAQQPVVHLRGVVTNDDGEPLQQATVYIAGSSFSATTDANGAFQLRISTGRHRVLCALVGYQSQEANLVVHDDRDYRLDFQLVRGDNYHLQEVEVVGKSAITEVRESPFNVVALDAKSLYNSTLDLGHMLDRASGVKIRETGGMGSNMSISLNGFTGRHIKLFMDGVPMEGFGSAFQLNNIPVNIADRIEVYKGVVPIEFGADAMGGVINIVTNQSANSYLDVSYSYGSFNTHKTNISVGHTTKAGFTFQLNAFQNYSDNDYNVRTNVLDVQTGNFSWEEYWVRRFNDAYHNETIMAKVGVVNKPWADRLLLGITLGQEKAEIQHANLMKIVFGMRERSGTTVLPSLSYEKKNLFVDNLHVRLTANYNRNYNHNIDTAARQYNWFGEYRPTRYLGESSYTLGKFYNDNASATANVNYRFNEKHSLAFNDVITGYERKNADRVAVTDVYSAIDTMRRANLKNVLGASYRYQHNKNWNTNLFGKYYYQRVIGPVDTSNVAGSTAYTERTESFSTTGYGVASTYFFHDFQFKASIEKAFRLPADNELFGDEVLETGNTSLRAENSLNYNVGVTLNSTIQDDHTLYADVNGYYRDINDYIQRLVEQRYGTAGYSNHGKVRNIGVDAELRYYYKNRLMVGGNVTYQDMRNKERYASSTGDRLSVTYNNRMRNVPYFFGNADAAYYVHDLWGMGNVLSLGYTFNFVGEFFLDWESLGNQNTKATLPQQLYHDFNMSYMMGNGRYNVAFEARNFTNSMLYDNFSLQKPGRSFSLKLRYFLIKRNG